MRYLRLDALWRMFGQSAVLAAGEGPPPPNIGRAHGLWPRVPTVRSSASAPMQTKEGREGNPIGPFLPVAHSSDGRTQGDNSDRRVVPRLACTTIKCSYSYWICTGRISLSSGHPPPSATRLLRYMRNEVHEDGDGGYCPASAIWATVALPSETQRPAGTEPSFPSVSPSRSPAAIHRVAQVQQLIQPIGDRAVRQAGGQAVTPRMIIVEEVRQRLHRVCPCRRA
jgi:hypothetical protein